MQSHPLTSSVLRISTVRNSAGRKLHFKTNARSAKFIVSPAFDGTIASACESVGLSLESMTETLRWARESDARVAQFFDVWDKLDTSERRVWGTVKVVRQRAGLKIVDLLGIKADVACRMAMYEAQIIVALSHVLVVEKTIERALTDKGVADRMALYKVTGLLPMPKGSQTTTAVQPVVAPRPEDTIRRLSESFNKLHTLPPIKDAASCKGGDE
jgi:hypothetical protein